ncbi:hypothetical protein GOP47_0029956 [Adiantum capillus-veneris]|nr:hypothetical protein GOP47_0029956 [Adiantum capillus-veneris]
MEAARSDFDSPPNSTGRYLGLQPEHRSTRGSPRFFAVEFDTFQNLEFDDPSASHIGIDVNSLNSSAFLDTSGNYTCCRRLTESKENPGQCPLCKELNDSSKSHLSKNSNKDNANFMKGSYPELFLYNNYTFTAWIEYDAHKHLIQLWMTNRTTDEWPANPCLWMNYNLSEFFLPRMYVGLSAASGMNFEGTTIFSWNFTIHGAESKVRRSKRMLTTYISIIMAMLIIAGVAVCIGLVAASRERTRKKLKKGRTFERVPHIQIESIATKRYSYRSLKRAAHSFNERGKVGEGGFSSVYKGVLEDGRQVAVKKLKDGVRMEAEFASEVEIISQIRHRNLLQLQGWCYEKRMALLVYQFMPNGSLDTYLFGSRRESHALDSEARFKVLIGVAAALEYLHNGLGDCVLHRDVKAANVLLTENFEAMLGDFGLARLITHDQEVTMTAAGTPGYVAPEVIYTGKATDKADVYGFGVLALEVACGRRVLDPSIEDRIPNWVWSLHQNGNIMDAIDPSLKLHVASPSYKWDKDEMDIEATTHGMMMEKVSLKFKWRCILHLGLLCCHPCPDARPTMRQVHQVLQESTLLPLPSSKPMYGISYDLSSLTSCTLSLSCSAPPISGQSTSST